MRDLHGNWLLCWKSLTLKPNHEAQIPSLTHIYNNCKQRRAVSKASLASLKDCFSLKTSSCFSLADWPDCGMLPWLRGCGHGTFTVSLSGCELPGQRGQHSSYNRSTSRWTHTLHDRHGDGPFHARSPVPGGYDNRLSLCGPQVTSLSPPTCSTTSPGWTWRGGTATASPR